MNEKQNGNIIIAELQYKQQIPIVVARGRRTPIRWPAVLWFSWFSCLPGEPIANLLIEHHP